MGKYGAHVVARLVLEDVVAARSVRSWTGLMKVGLAAGRLAVWHSSVL